MKYIVLNTEQNELFMEFKKQFTEILAERNVDILPIEIKNHLFIINEDVLYNDNFKELESYLLSLELREVADNEFMQYEV